MEGIINRMVGEVVGRLSVRGPWGSLVPPLNPVADPPAATGFDALPAPEAREPRTLGRRRRRRKKKEAATPLAPVDGIAGNKQVQPQEESKKERYPKRRTDATTWAKVVGMGGEMGWGELRSSPDSHRRLQAGSRNRVGAAAKGATLPPQ